MRQESLHLRRPHLFRVTFVVEEDETFNPGDISLLRADGISLASDNVTHLFKELGTALRA